MKQLLSKTKRILLLPFVGLFFPIQARAQMQALYGIPQPIYGANIPNPPLQVRLLSGVLDWVMNNARIAATIGLILAVLILALIVKLVDKVFTHYGWNSQKKS